ncbi:MAG TPA: SDR family NAD(P)-dependent oxidoreductase [Actinophytocola sp.]|uniref:SDR family NAD(P)-dependent oxidoreductase n=1 Tax=Actinophytocola sp. TaxID=1872138 RepID=UPI002DDCDE7F|nr:SDR family NAD(P)-dependent oxidoreductase [Actinophytocola sp.]HEV2783826.1 SDR family NAD(P)-dependent oxidoreductase [Actinophytocola sp.]
MELRGKSVLVTGATGGLGQAIARRLRDEGCVPLLTGRRAEVLEPLADELGGRAIPADLSNPDDVDRVARAAADVDVLVANAGLPGNGLLEGYTIEQIDRVLGVNLRSPIVLARLIGERMLARGQGHIVLVSSLSGKSTTPVSSLYNATKFGLRGFALALRADWEPRGVGVSCVNPGPIAEAGMFVDGGGTLPPGIRPRSPRDVAAAVVRAIVQNRAEIDVADLVTKAGATLALLAPQTVAWLGRLVGADRVARQLAEGHKDKR